MAEVLPGPGRFGHLVFHFRPVVAVKAVTLDNHWFDFLPQEDRQQRFFYSRSARSRRAGYHYNRVFFRHRLFQINAVKVFF